MIQAFWKTIAGEWKSRGFNSEVTADRFVKGKQALGFDAYYIINI